MDKQLRREKTLKKGDGEKRKSRKTSEFSCARADSIALGMEKTMLLGEIGRQAEGPESKKR